MGIRPASTFKTKIHNPRRGRRVLRTEYMAPFFDFLESLVVPGHDRTLYGKSSGRSKRFRKTSMRKDTLVLTRGTYLIIGRPWY